MSAWLPALLVFVAAVFGTLTLALLWEGARDWMRRRRTRRQLEVVLDEHAHLADAAPGLVRDREKDSALTRALPGTRTLETLLHQARVDLSVESFLVLTLAVAGGAAAAVFVVGGGVFFIGLTAFVAAWIPYWWVTRRRTQRMNRFEEEFPEAIDLLTRAIRAGHPISSGMRMVGEEAAEVVAQEFRQTFEEMRFGVPFDDALLNLVDRMNSVDVRIFATALLIQREVGGNLAEILDNLARTIRDRFFIRRQLRVYTAQGRLSGWVLGLLPVFVATVIYLLEPDYMMILFGSLGGLALLGCAVVLQLMGVLWIRSIINIDI